MEPKGRVDMIMTIMTLTKEANLREDFAEFTRKLRLKEYFIDKNYQSEDIVRPKSEFTPQSGRVPKLDDIASEIETMKIKEKKFKDNLSKSERKALNELRHNNKIVIKQADKGGTVVIMTKNITTKWLWNVCWIIRPLPKPTTRILIKESWQS